MWGRLKCVLGFHVWYRPRLGEPIVCRRCALVDWGRTR